jgi:Fe-S-cluster containining protein
MPQLELTPEQQALAEFADITATTLLGKERSAASASDLIRKVDIALDHEIGQSHRRGNRAPACHTGCSACCYRVVQVTLPEIAAIGEFLEVRPDDGLSERLERYERAVAPSFGRNLSALRPECPFLLDGECSIYEVRPLRCRGLNSLDVSACEKWRDRADEQVPIPAVRGQMESAIAASLGLAAGLAKAGVFNRFFDLGRAIAILNADRDAVEHHFKGDLVLTPALVVGEERGKAIPELTGLIDSPQARLEVDHHYRLCTIDKVDEARGVLKSDHPASWIRRLTLPSFYESEEEIERWRDRFSTTLERMTQMELDPVSTYRAIPLVQTFELAYHQRNDKELLCQFGDFLVDQIALKVAPDLVEPITSVRKPGPLRVGYIGCNLSGSNGGYWSLGWLKNHTPDFETFAFFLRDTGDTVTAEFHRSAHHFYHLKGDPVEAARLIRSLDLDFLIYPEIGMAGRNYQFACFRLARKQASAWGHPVTSGLSTIDYYLSSELMEPENGQDHYLERLVRLPGSGLAYTRKPTPIARTIREDFGLRGPVVLSCQNPMKYGPRWDSLYAEISQNLGHPIVFLEGVGFNVGPLKARMDKAGVLAQWIPTIRATDFLALLKLADLSLDSPGWNGGNTTIQALDLGCPVVSLVGDTMRGRHGKAFLTQSNVPNFLATTRSQFVELATASGRAREAMENATPEAMFEDRAPAQALNAFIREVST